MNRIDATHYTLTTGSGRTLHAVRRRGWWEVSAGGSYGWLASFATLPAARAWAATR